MTIIWHGLSCVEIVAKTPQGDVTVVIDPYEAGTGLRPRSLTAQLALSTHEGPDAGALGSVDGAPFLVKGPGEFEAKGVFVYGIAAPTKAGPHTVYRVEAEDMVIAHLGALDRPLSPAELEHFAKVDVLLVPAGGGRVLSPEQAAEVVAQVEPRVAVPVMLAADGLKESFADASAFFKAVGVAPSEALTKFKILKKDLPQEDMKVVVLNRD